MMSKLYQVSTPPHLQCLSPGPQFTPCIKLQPSPISKPQPSPQFSKPLPPSQVPALSQFQACHKSSPHTEIKSLAMPCPHTNPLFGPNNTKFQPLNDSLSMYHAIYPNHDFNSSICFTICWRRTFRRLISLGRTTFVSLRQCPLKRLKTLTTWLLRLWTKENQIIINNK